MPQIIANPGAQAGAGTPRVLQVVNFGGLTPPSPIAFGAGLGNALGDTGTKLLNIADKLQEQQDDLDLASASNTYQAEVTRLRIDMDSSEITSKEDLHNKSRMFVRGASEIRENLETNMNNRVKNKFRINAQKSLQAEGLQNYTDGLKKWNSHQIAVLDEGLIEASKQSAFAPTTDQRDEINTFAYNMIDAAVARGNISATEGVKRKEQFKVGSETDQLAIIAHSNPELAIELDELGRFPNVDPRTKNSMINSAVVKIEARTAKAREQLDKATKNYNESVQRSVVERIHNHSITAEYIEDNKYAYTAEQYDAYMKVWREQQGGIGIGNPQTEKTFAVHVDTATPQNAESVQKDLITLYNRNEIGREKFEPWGRHLSVLIERKGTLERQEKREAEAEQRRKDALQLSGKKEQETRAREIHTRGLSAVLDQVDKQLKPTDKYDVMDDDIMEARGAAHAAIQRRVIEGGENPFDAYRKEMPRHLARVQTRMESRLKYITEHLIYPSKQLLNENRTKIGDDKYFEQLKLMEEYLDIRDAHNDLEKVRNRNKGPGK